MLKHYGKLLIRTPLQSLHQAYQFNKNASLLFDEGIYLSSSDFYQEYHKPDITIAEQEKIALSFAKYWLRSSTRCTPYGTFAGSQVVDITPYAVTRLQLNNSDEHARHIRLDMNFVSKIIENLCKNDAIRNQIAFYANNSLYQVDDTLRYVEFTIHNNARKYHLSAIEATAYLQYVLEVSREGATLDRLSEVLMSETSVSKEEAYSYLSELCVAQILIPAIEPTVTGLEPIENLLAQLQTLKGIEEITTKLEALNHLLMNPSIGAAYYQLLESKISELLPDELISKNTIQTDLYLSMDSPVISTAIMDKLLVQIEELCALSSRNTKTELETFKEKFYQKYEEAQVPLAIALDAELGIGYSTSQYENAGDGEFVNNLAIAFGGSNQADQTLSAVQQFCIKKYEEWINSNSDHIVITEEELKTLSKHSEKHKYANSQYIMGSLLQKNERDFDENNFVFALSAMGGPSGANLLGRFAHGHQKIVQLIDDLVKDEEEQTPEIIYAEIAHLPEARVGNILLRPTFRKYEIPFVGLSGVPIENQIELDDIMVSVRNNALLLWSKKHNKQIIPRLSTAHNFSFNSLPAYKFLADMQFQDLAFAPNWDWGSISVFKYLPRVIYKDVILHKAIWRIEEKDIEKLPKDKNLHKAYFADFCITNKMPHRVIYKEGDNDLLIDFKEEMGIELFLHYIKRYKRINLEEFLFTESNCIVRNKQGLPYTNEIILPIYNNKSEKTFYKSKPKEATIKRNFLPYSEWIYFKVYCGAKSADKILSTVIESFITESLESKLFEQFFFIRYQDESGGHFRIRFYNSNLQKQTVIFTIFMQLLEPYMENGLITKVLLDTYKREIERYSSELITVTEQLFHYDSVCVLRLLNLVNTIEDADKYRLIFGMRGIDVLLSDFGLDLSEKQMLLKTLQGGFFNEFGGHKTLKKQLNDRYRLYRTFIEAHLNPENDIENGIEEAVVFFRQRSIDIEQIVNEIKSKISDIKSDWALFDLLGSYIHMYVNRLFIAKQRKYELVIYHLLERHYHSQLGRQKVK